MQKSCRLRCCCPRVSCRCPDRSSNVTVDVSIERNPRNEHRKKNDFVFFGRVGWDAVGMRDCKRYVMPKECELWMPGCKDADPLSCCVGRMYVANWIPSVWYEMLTKTYRFSLKGWMPNECDVMSEQYNADRSYAVNKEWIMMLKWTPGQGWIM